MGTGVLRAQAADSIRSESVAGGVTHTRFVRLAGPWIVNVLAIDMRRMELELRHSRALDQLRGREKTTAIVARAVQGGETVLAAVNTDFFDLKTGENENNSVIGGEWWKGVAVSDSPADSSGKVHAQFALDARRRPLIDQFAFDGVVIGSRDTFPLSALNAIPRAVNSAALFTSRYRTPAPLDSVRQTIEVQLAPVGQSGDSLLFVRAPQSAGGAVLTGYESFGRRVGSLRNDDTLRVVLRTLPRTPPLDLLVGGWPRIVRDGVNIAASSGALEGAIPRNIGLRNPRTAVGFSRDSNTLYLVTVDGRSKTSVGMTGVELGGLMIELGAYQALNFDGGGSTTMVVRDRIVNTPSDSAGERAVGDALLLVQHANRSRPAPPALPALDSARLMANLSALAADSMEGRKMGTPGGVRAREFLVRELTRLGFSPARQSFSSAGVNLLATLRGTKHADRCIVVSAHYDHLGIRNGTIYPGADDNASGTSAVLAMAQWFKAHPPEHSIIFAFFDGEEEGLLGAKAFVNSPPVPLGNMIANVNLDMVSRSTKGEIYASGSSEYPAMKPLLDSIAQIAPVRLLLGHDTGIGESNWIQQSDQGAFANKKIPFIYFGVEDHPDYHKPGDTVAHIEPAFFYRCAKTIAEFVRRLDLAAIVR